MRYNTEHVEKIAKLVRLVRQRPEPKTVGQAKLSFDIGGLSLSNNIRTLPPLALSGKEPSVALCVKKRGSMNDDVVIEYWDITCHPEATQTASPQQLAVLVRELLSYVARTNSNSKIGDVELCPPPDNAKLHVDRWSQKQWEIKRSLIVIQWTRILASSASPTLQVRGTKFVDPLKLEGGGGPSKPIDHPLSRESPSPHPQPQSQSTSPPNQLYYPIISGSLERNKVVVVEQQGGGGGRSFPTPPFAPSSVPLKFTRSPAGAVTMMQNSFGGFAESFLLPPANGSFPMATAMSLVPIIVNNSVTTLQQPQQYDSSTTSQHYFSYSIAEDVPFSNILNHSGSSSSSSMDGGTSQNVPSRERNESPLAAHHHRVNSAEECNREAAVSSFIRLCETAHFVDEPLTNILSLNK